MKGEMEERINRLLRTQGQVEEQMADPALLSNQEEFKRVSRQLSHLARLREKWEDYLKVGRQLRELQRALQEEEESELIDLFSEEKRSLEQRQEKNYREIEELLLPQDPREDRNTILELRSGAGGEEAALFVGDCTRMYQLYAQGKGWEVQLLSSTSSERGGCKEYIALFSGKEVYRHLRFEAGTHRVQRIPETESQGRVHTSTITIAAFPQPDPRQKISIEPRELRIDTYRSSGAGGQHVNTTDSAVRITHLPSGIVVTSQQEKSQHQNRAIAMLLLEAKLEQKEEEEAREREQKMRKCQVGSGERSEKIRTYNFPQNRFTDHRIPLTVYNLDQIMEGRLDDIVSALRHHFQAQSLNEEAPL